MIFICVSFISCKNERPRQKNIKIDVLNNYEFVLNGNEYSLNQLQDILLLEDSKLYKNQKYDIVLRVHKGVNMETLQEIKLEFTKIKDHINEIKYSHEN